MDIFWSNTRQILFLTHSSLSLLNRQASPIDNPLYTTVEQQKPVVRPRVSPSRSKPNNPIKEPLDSTVPYATPQKKNKPKKSRKEPQELTTGKSFVKHVMVQQMEKHINRQKLLSKVYLKF